MRPAKTDQPVHPRGLIRVYADRMCLLQPSGYPKRDKQEPLPYCVNVRADQSFAGHRSYCRFCRALVHAFYGPRHSNTCLRAFVDSEGLEQLAHSLSAIKIIEY